MSELSKSSCEACRIDAPLLSEEELKLLQVDIPEWQCVIVDGVSQLQRTYIFKDFVDALSFANRVGQVAEDEGHHPALLVEWGKVQVNWWSHKIRGLHKNDVIMAAKTDALFTH